VSFRKKDKNKVAKNSDFSHDEFVISPWPQAASYLEDLSQEILQPRGTVKQIVDGIQLNDEPD
jgi:hypothetical protein